MPKAKGKGGKNRRRGKNDEDMAKRELIFKEDGQEYAQVVKMLGNGRLEAKCQDGETRLGQIRGQMRKKVWIVPGDIILLSLRDFQDDRADVIHKYTADEARNLKTYGELKSDFSINENAADGESFATRASERASKLCFSSILHLALHHQGISHTARPLRSLAFL